jgi:capsular exopolysaccharide synthesis family protein
MIKAEIEQAETMMKALRTEKERARVELQSTAQRVTEVQAADVPQNSNRLAQLLKVVLAGLAAFVLGAFGVAYVEFLARRINNKADVSQDLGLRVLGTLPALASRRVSSRRRAKAASEDYWSSLLTESIDTIRTNLLRDQVTAGNRCLMITSAGSREGKTTLAVHLAMSIARSNRRTLLLDGDLRRPAVHRLYDLSTGAGLSEVLRGELPVEQAIRPGPVDKLSILTAGRCDHQVIRAIATGELGQLLRRLGQEYDFIIVDTCPVLPVADALLIGQHVDGVLLSIRPRISQLLRVYEAWERLQTARIPVLGGIVNGVHDGNYAYEYDYLFHSPHHAVPSPQVEA